MSDFASAAMIRVLVQGMRELGLQPPSEAAGAGVRGGRVATVPLKLKRLVVARAVEQGGLACLAMLGRGVHHYRHDPTHVALASARSAAEFFVRWQRLERYVHSHHRCEVLDIQPGKARLRHVSRDDSAPPTAAEDLVVLGLLAALLETLGLEDVQAHAGGVAVFPRADPTAVSHESARGATADWRITWRGEVTLARDETPARTASWQPSLDDLVAPSTWPDVLTGSARLLLADLAHPLPLPDLAAALGRAPRSLQRELARAGLGYAALLAELRCRAAACWLLRSPASIAEIGFLCGYADQAHFTRDLRSRVGLTPARYREAFGERAAAQAARPGCSRKKRSISALASGPRLSV